MPRGISPIVIKPREKRRPFKRPNEFGMPGENLDAFFDKLQTTFQPILETLTPREAEILPLLAFGQPNSMIAANFGISPKTLDVHRGNIMRKFGVANRQLAIAYLSATEALAAQEK